MIGTHHIEYDLGGESQPTATSCWATSFAMIINFKQNMGYTAADIAAAIGRDLDSYQTSDDERNVASQFGLNYAYVKCNDVDQWAALLNSCGPLYVSPDGSDHSIVLTGLRTGEDIPTQWFYNDPWKGESQIIVAKLSDAFDAVSDDSALFAYYA